MKSSTKILFAVLSSVLISSCTTTPERAANQQSSNVDEVAQLKRQLNQMRREQQLVVEENRSIKKRYEELIPQIQELSSLLLDGIKNAERKATRSKKPAEVPARQNSSHITPLISNNDENTNHLIVPEGYTYIGGGEVLSSEEWLATNSKNKEGTEVKQKIPATNNVSYDIRLAAEDPEQLQEISKILVEHGITDQFIISNEDSLILFLGRFKSLNNATGHSKKIHSITGISPEIVKKVMNQSTEAPLR